MTLICGVLNWGFKGGNGAPLPIGGGSAAGAAARRGAAEAAAALRPGQAWAELLLPDAATDWLLALLPALRGAGAAGAPLAARGRQVVVAFCSLAGDVFPRTSQSDGGAGAGGKAAASAVSPASVRHCARMLQAVLPWVHPAAAAVHQAVASDEGELVDGCR
jgi:hypothetical protein